MRGRQNPGPKWTRLCAEVRNEVLKLCPLDNRRWVNRPGTFRRTELAEQTGVNFALLRRLLDNNCTVEPDTILALAEWLGWDLRWVRVSLPPSPPSVAWTGVPRTPRGQFRRSRPRRSRGPRR